MALISQVIFIKIYPVPCASIPFDIIICSQLKMIETHLNASAIDNPASGDIIISEENGATVVTKVQEADSDRVFFTESGSSVRTRSRQAFKVMFEDRGITEITQEMGVRVRLPQCDMSPNALHG